jgi:hypothetical protein
MSVEHKHTQAFPLMQQFKAMQFQPLGKIIPATLPPKPTNYYQKDQRDQYQKRVVKSRLQRRSHPICQ